MTESRESLAGEAREAAETAPGADPEVAAEALREAQARKARGTGQTQDPGQSHTQPVYATQNKADGPLDNGENIHRGKDAVISEFDDPEGNAVPNG